MEKLKRLSRSQHPITWSVVKLGTSSKRPVTGYRPVPVDSLHCPSSCNVGLLTGKPSGTFVIDLNVLKESDAGKACGLKVWKMIISCLSEEERELVDSAPHVRSPSGGEHLYFSYHNELMNTLSGNAATWSTTLLNEQFNTTKFTEEFGEVQAKIDCRCNKAYIVIPPSVINGKVYTWLKEPVDGQALPSLPDQLKNILQPNRVRRRLTRPRPPTTASSSGTPRSRQTTTRRPSSEDKDFEEVQAASRRRYCLAAGNNGELSSIFPFVFL